MADTPQFRLNVKLNDASNNDSNATHNEFRFMTLATKDQTVGSLRDNIWATFKRIYPEIDGTFEIPRIKNDRNFDLDDSYKVCEAFNPVDGINIVVPNFPSKKRKLAHNKPNSHNSKESTTTSAQALTTTTSTSSEGLPSSSPSSSVVSKSASGTTAPAKSQAGTASNNDAKKRRHEDSDTNGDPKAKVVPGTAPFSSAKSQPHDNTAKSSTQPTTSQPPEIADIDLSGLPKRLRKKAIAERLKNLEQHTGTASVAANAQLPSATSSISSTKKSHNHPVPSANSKSLETIKPAVVANATTPSTMVDEIGKKDRARKAEEGRKLEEAAEKARKQQESETAETEQRRQAAAEIEIAEQAMLKEQATHKANAEAAQRKKEQQNEAEAAAKKQQERQEAAKKEQAKQETAKNEQEKQEALTKENQKNEADKREKEKRAAAEKEANHNNSSSNIVGKESPAESSETEPTAPSAPAVVEKTQKKRGPKPKQKPVDSSEPGSESAKETTSLDGAPVQTEIPVPKPRGKPGPKPKPKLESEAEVHSNQDGEASKIPTLGPEGAQTTAAPKSRKKPGPKPKPKAGADESLSQDAEIGSSDSQEIITAQVTTEPKTPGKRGPKPKPKIPVTGETDSTTNVQVGEKVRGKPGPKPKAKPSTEDTTAENFADGSLAEVNTVPKPRGKPGPKPKVKLSTQETTTEDSADGSLVEATTKPPGKPGPKSKAKSSAEEIGTQDSTGGSQEKDVSSPKPRSKPGPKPKADADKVIVNVVPEVVVNDVSATTAQSLLGDTALLSSKAISPLALPLTVDKVSEVSPRVGPLDASQIKKGLNPAIVESDVTVDETPLDWMGEDRQQDIFDHFKNQQKARPSPSPKLRPTTGSRSQLASGRTSPTLRRITNKPRSDSEESDSDSERATTDAEEMNIRRTNMPPMITSSRRGKPIQSPAMVAAIAKAAAAQEASLSQARRGSVRQDFSAVYTGQNEDEDEDEDREDADVDQLQDFGVDQDNLDEDDGRMTESEDEGHVKQKKKIVSQIAANKRGSLAKVEIKPLNIDALPPVMIKQEEMSPAKATDSPMVKALKMGYNATKSGVDDDSDTSHSGDDNVDSSDDSTSDDSDEDDVDQLQDSGSESDEDTNIKGNVKKSVVPATVMVSKSVVNKPLSSSESESDSGSGEDDDEETKPAAAAKALDEIVSFAPTVRSASISFPSSQGGLSSKLPSLMQTQSTLSLLAKSGYATLSSMRSGQPSPSLMRMSSMGSNNGSVTNKDSYGNGGATANGNGTGNGTKRKSNDLFGALALSKAAGSGSDDDEDDDAESSSEEDSSDEEAAAKKANGNGMKKTIKIAGQKKRRIGV